ncbi:MAG TPA: metallophosphoesterase family protein, partial [Acidimicrobiales bacterium]
AQIAVLRALVERVDQPERLVFSSGNHDLSGPDAEGEQAPLWLPSLRSLGAHVDGDSVRLGDALVTVCPWWDGPAGRSRLVEQMERDGATRGQPWVWVYHWPPDGSPTCLTTRGHYGDADLLGWIGEHQPDVVLTGHVHDPPFKPDGAWADRVGGTWVFNAGRQIGPVPAHIEIDLDAQVATWHSLLGVEVQPMADDPITVRPSF